eukprot:12123815-Alexandrium_andersonii.AAC.1
MGTAQLSTDPWRDGDALAALRRDAVLDHGAPAGDAASSSARPSGTTAASARSRTPPHGSRMEAP